MSFDTLAPYYRGFEFVTAGRMLQRCRTSFLPETQICRRALLLGEGPGRFLLALLRTNPRIMVTCVESSQRMINVAVRQLSRAGFNATRVHFEQCDARTWQCPGDTYDLVATHFFMDCFSREELDRLVAKIGRTTTASAKWLMTDFCVPANGWQRWRARVLLAVMYAFFRAATGLSASRLTPTDEFLKTAGFRLAERRLANCGLVQADLWKRNH